MKWLVLLLVIVVTSLSVRAWREDQVRSDALQHFDFEEAKEQES
jgi:hypothetical protein